MTTMMTKRATIADLMKVEGKAELIGGRIQALPSAGRRRNLTSAAITYSLHAFTERGGGEAYSATMTFVVFVSSTDRDSFCPDASYYAKTLPSIDEHPGPIYDAPTFAVEVRSDEDYGPTAERRLAAKRAEYFEAGTLVVWDVDPEEKVVRCYRHGDSEQAVVFAVGETADAEPAVPGWRVEVSDLFGLQR